MQQALHGKDEVIHLATTALLAGGHVLVEDVPGVGKTLLAKSLAETFGCTWNRVQFTPDLLPSDLIGVNVFEPENGKFTFHPGPVFANILLADEVNRASPKTQSGLLECMEEQQVTVDATTFHLQRPFFVIATQNPVEHEGTYPLPESQLDRFLIKLTLGYPSRSAAIAMLDSQGKSSEPRASLLPISNPEEILQLIRIASQCHTAALLKEYVLDIVEATRKNENIALGASPRACIHLLRAAKATAVLQGRDYAVPDDIKFTTHAVLEHRLVLSPAARAQGITPKTVLTSILEHVPVPHPQ